MKRNKHILLLILFVIFISDISIGQCVMCKAVGEESANQGGIGSGLNKGIFFLMSIPYIIFGIAGTLLWKHFNKEGE